MNIVYNIKQAFFLIFLVFIYQYICLKKEIQSNKFLIQTIMQQDSRQDEFKKLKPNKKNRVIGDTKYQKEIQGQNFDAPKEQDNILRQINTSERETVAERPGQMKQTDSDIINPLTECKSQIQNFNIVSSGNAGGSNKESIKGSLQSYEPSSSKTGKIVQEIDAQPTTTRIYPPYDLIQQSGYNPTFQHLIDSTANQRFTQPYKNQNIPAYLDQIHSNQQNQQQFIRTSQDQISNQTLMCSRPEVQQFFNQRLIQVLQSQVQELRFHLRQEKKKTQKLEERLEKKDETINGLEIQLKQKSKKFEDMLYQQLLKKDQHTYQLRKKCEQNQAANKQLLDEIHQLKAQLRQNQSQSSKKSRIKQKKFDSTIFEHDESEQLHPQRFNSNYTSSFQDQQSLLSTQIEVLKGYLVEFIDRRFREQEKTKLQHELISQVKSLVDTLNDKSRFQLRNKNPSNFQTTKRMNSELEVFDSMKILKTHSTTENTNKADKSFSTEVVQIQSGKNTIKSKKDKQILSSSKSNQETEKKNTERKSYDQETNANNLDDSSQRGTDRLSTSCKIPKILSHIPTPQQLSKKSCNKK